MTGEVRNLFGDQFLKLLKILVGGSTDGKKVAWKDLKKTYNIHFQVGNFLDTKISMGHLTPELNSTPKITKETCLRSFLSSF